MNKDDSIFVAGHNGLVGSAIVRALTRAGYTRLLTVDRAECDLIRQQSVEDWFRINDVDHVFLAAARVGGIHANDTYRGEFIYENLAIQTNVIHAAYQNSVKKLLFLGSSCIYPRDCPQPMREEHLLSGPLEATNEPYAIAKIAGLKMVEAYNRQYDTRYLTLMPTNLYGAEDNFDLNTSHVIPALLRKFHEASMSGAPYVSVWGSGTPRREFLHVDDLAEACVFCMEQGADWDMMNVGSGEEVSIAQLAQIVASVTGFTGEIRFDAGMPDGTPRKLLDTSRLNQMGWRPRISLRDGLESTLGWYLEDIRGDAA